MDLCRRTRPLHTLPVLLCRAVAHRIEIDRNAHRIVEGCLAHIVIVERGRIVHPCRRQIVGGAHHLKIRTNPRIVADARNVIVLLRTGDRLLRRFDILLRRTQVQIRRTHIEADLLIRRRKSFLGFAKYRLCRIDLRRRHTVVEDIPRCTQPRRPCIARFMIVLEGAFARDRARRRRIHRRLIARLCRTNPLLCTPKCIECRRTVRAVEQSIVRTVIEGEIIVRIAQLIVDVERRIRRHTDHIVQRRHRDLIVVPRRRQVLLCIRQLHLRGKHIRTRHRTRTQLRIHIREMSLQRRHRILAYLHQIACLKNIKIVCRRHQAN